MNTGKHTIFELVDNLVKREGGYVNHPNDRGGPTKYGVTQKTLASYLGHPCSVAEVEGLTLAQARNIYTKLYWVAPKFNELGLHPVLIEMVFDAGVHHGPKRAAKLLQTAVGVKADGHIGPVTLNAAARMKFSDIGSHYMAARVKYIGRIITRLPKQAVFAAGWAARMAEFIEKIPKLGSL